jgi:hypothetical protein
MRYQKDDFYNTLSTITQSRPIRNIIMVMEDLDAGARKPDVYSTMDCSIYLIVDTDFDCGFLPFT